MPTVTLEAVDLSRDSKRLLAWLAEPHVAKWWGDAARAMQHARECTPASHALIAVDGTPVGYVCWEQLPMKELEAADLTDLPSGVVDIDILVGEPGLLGRGIGPRALQLLLERLRSVPSVAFAGLGASTSNASAIRCFEKAGFRRHRSFQDPEWGPCTYLITEVHAYD